MQKITLFAWICLICAASATPMGFTHATTSPKSARTAPGVVHWTTGVHTKGSTALNQTNSPSHGKSTVQAATTMKDVTTTTVLPSVDQGSTTAGDTAPLAASEATTQGGSTDDTTTTAAHSGETVTTTEATTAATAATAATGHQFAAKEAQIAVKQRKAKKNV